MSLTTGDFVTRSEEETYAFAREFAENTRGGTVIALSGELGAGKTAFVKGFCAHFGCGDQVSSPTFTIINEYSGDLPIVHCDLYRISRLEELHAIGFEELFTNDQIVLIEWAERGYPLLPVPRIEMVAEHAGDSGSRRFRWQEFESGGESILPGGSGV